MRKVLVYSLLLVAGLVISQLIGDRGATGIRILTMAALAFIMIHVGYEFEIDRSQPRRYLWDYAVAGTAAAFPWVLCALYFVFAMSPRELWGHADLWKESLLEARFASPTSAGVLFSMLAAAGLAATWLFRKARILAIFDDLDTILLMIPLKIIMVGLKWQLGVVVLLIALLLWLAWRYLHEARLPITWPWVLAYSAAITIACEAIYIASKVIDDTVPVHVEVLLPAFVLGCVLARPQGASPHSGDDLEGHEEGPETPQEQRVSTIVSACFMVLVGLSMPPILGSGPAAASSPTASVAAAPGADLPTHSTVAVEQKSHLEYAGASPQVLEAKHRFPGWGWIAIHVAIVTVLSNVGKMFPTFCYRREASLRERLALSIGMFPRGEVGAGVLVISLSYGLGGPVLTVAVLSLALNLLCTGLFILAVRKLIAGYPQQTPAVSPIPSA